MEFKDYYKSLGVTKTATADEIRRAFRKLAKTYHPDVAKDKKTAEAKFKEINEAYEVLGDADKRKKYDELGSSWNQPQGGGFPGGGFPGGGFPPGGGRRTAGGMEYHFEGTGFSDFFEQFFGGGGGNPFGGGRGGNGFQQRRPASANGEDVEAEILVTLEEALRGNERTVSLRRSDAGDGKLQTLKIKIPAGVREGQRIRLTGQGDPGVGQGQPGDLYLKIKFSRHPHYRVKDQDLFYDLDLAPWEAVLGAKVTVTTLDGEKVSVNVPAGVQPGTQLRLRGKGLPDSKKERQDLFLKINIEVPEAVDDKERALWEKLAQDSSFKPRG